MSDKGIGGHHQPNRGRSDDWLTPPEIIQALGPFDLDPCACVGQPWATAERHHTIEDDGFSQPWFGRVWLNPPYGPEAQRWLERLADHGNGIALTFARTETSGFFAQVWERATAVLFLRGRLFFHHPDGARAKHNAGGPSVLIAYGERNAQALGSSGLDGALCAFMLTGKGGDMGIVKRGTGEILPEPGDDQKLAKANWSEEDEEELAQESAEADR